MSPTEILRNYYNIKFLMATPEAIGFLQKYPEVWTLKEKARNYLHLGEYTAALNCLEAIKTLTRWK